jgi:hypothetical protein
MQHQQWPKQKLINLRVTLFTKSLNETISEAVVVVSQNFSHHAAD